MDLNGKNVVFVGGLGGIGFETCKILMKKRLANLVVLDFIENAKAVQTLQAVDPKTKVAYIKFDITDKASIKRAIGETVAQVKYIDVLVNGAGIIADRDVELTMNVNLVGLIHTTMEALPYMDKTRSGRGGMIVNIASVLGLEPSPSIAVYTASKFGVIGFTRSLADSYYYNKTGVAVMAICPGLTETPLLHNMDGRDTFDYSKPLTEEFVNAVRQKASDCAQNFVKAIEQAKNGNMFILDRGNMELVVPKTFWQM